MNRLALVLTLGLASSAASQQASYAFFGSGCMPDQYFQVAGLPRIGTSLRITMPAFTGPLVPAFWLLTSAQRRPTPVSLPSVCGDLHLGSPIHATLGPPWQGAGCNLFCSGFFVLDFPIPNHTGLLGLSFFQQVCAAYPPDVINSAPPWFQLSRAAHGVIGR